MRAVPNNGMLVGVEGQGVRIQWNCLAGTTGGPAAQDHGTGRCQRSVPGHTPVWPSACVHGAKTRLPERAETYVDNSYLYMFDRGEYAVATCEDH